MEDMLRFALGYSRRGYDIVPLIPNTKQPMQAFANKPPLTEEEIKEIWTKTPNANIAIKTVDFFAIDIDVHGNKNGYESLKKWKYLKDIPRTSQVVTASGGKHLYFKKRVGDTIPQKIAFLEGVDIKYNVNNYVVAPPSEINGKIYYWDMDKSLPNLQLAEATKELMDAIRETAGIESEDKLKYKGALSQFKGNGPKVSKVTMAVNECLEGLGGEGTRNNKVASYTGKLISMGIEREIVELLVNVMNDKSPKPLNPRELSTTIQSMYATDSRYNNN